MPIPHAHPLTLHMTPLWWEYHVSSLTPSVSALHAPLSQGDENRMGSGPLLQAMGLPPGGANGGGGGGPSGAARELLTMELCLYCQQPCEVGLFAVEPVWCCSCW